MFEPLLQTAQSQCQVSQKFGTALLQYNERRQRARFLRLPVIMDVSDRASALARVVQRPVVRGFQAAHAADVIAVLRLSLLRLLALLALD